MEDKTMVVTGGTGGLGFHTAKGLAELGATVVVTGRNQSRGEEAVAKLRSAAGHERVHLIVGDLARRSGIEDVAEQLRKDHPRLDVLINNAGSLATKREKTEDGLERDLAVNVAAPVLLSRALAPALAAAAPSRVLNVTGGAPFGSLDIAGLEAERGEAGLAWYTQTKRAMEAASLALAEELAPQGIHVNVVYPGAASTGMTQAMQPGMLPWYMRAFWPLFRSMMKPDEGRGAEKAARSSIWGATTDELTDVHGRYYDTKCRPTKFHASVHDPENQKRVLALAQL
ncbi:MAG: SDR family NAD(P)-dependent oxidoreductase [Myxococcota bacterium]